MGMYATGALGTAAVASPSPLDMTSAGTVLVHYRGLGQTSAENGVILEQWIDATGLEGIQLRWSGNIFLQARFADASAQSVAGSTQFARFALSNSWVHLGMTFDGTTVTFYANGFPIGAFAQPRTPTNGGTRTTDALLGFTTATVSLCDLRVWKRALNPAEVRLAMTGKLFGDEAGAYYRFGSNGQDASSNAFHLSAIPISATKGYADDPPFFGEQYGRRHRPYRGKVFAGIPLGFFMRSA